MDTLRRRGQEEASMTTGNTKARLYLPRQGGTETCGPGLWSWGWRKTDQRIGMTKCKRIWAARVRLFYSCGEMWNFQILKLGCDLIWPWREDRVDQKAKAIWAFWTSQWEKRTWWQETHQEDRTPSSWRVTSRNDGGWNVGWEGLWLSYCVQGCDFEGKPAGGDRRFGESIIHWCLDVLSLWGISECVFSGSGRPPGEGHRNPLQYSHLENPMDRGAWRAAAHGIAKESDVSDQHFNFPLPECVGTVVGLGRKAGCIRENQSSRWRWRWKPQLCTIILEGYLKQLGC